MFAVTAAETGETTPATSPTAAKRWWRAVVIFLLVAVLIGAGLFWRLQTRVSVAPAPTVAQHKALVVPLGSGTEGSAADTVAAEATAAAAGVDTAALRAQVAEIMDAAAGDSGFGRLHAQVRDAATGEVLWSSRAEAPATPASSLKVFTAAAVLLGMDPDKRVRTEVLTVPGSRDIVIRGAGDPTLSRGGVGFFPGAASIADLAAQIRRARPEGVGAVRVDASLFPEVFHPTWEQAGMAEGYIAPVVPVMLDAGRLDPTGVNSPRSPRPAEDVAEALAQQLGGTAAGLAKPGATEGGQVLAAVDSAPLQVRVREMMLHSDNVLAESLARELAIARGLPPTFAGAAQAVRDTLAEHGFRMKGAVMADTSGLSPDNRVSATQLAEILALAAAPYQPEVLAPERAALISRLRPLLDALPVAGVSGTLDDRFAGAAGAGVVRAKTGTLDRVSALAGYVATDSGAILSFALLSNDANLLPARAAADRVTSALAEI